MNRNLSSKIGYRLKSNPLHYFGDQILAEIQAFEGPTAQPHSQKELTMKPTLVKPATATPAAPSTSKPGAFGALLSRIQKCLSSITPTPEQLPTITPVIPQAKSRDAYPASLIQQLVPIPESYLTSLATDTQRMQSDARANQVIPSLLNKHQELLLIEDQNSLTGEQTKLRALLSEFGWYLDGWIDASRTELRPSVGGKV